jgi:hypothetical protein
MKTTIGSQQPYYGIIDKRTEYWLRIEDETTKWHTLDTPYDKFPTNEQLFN